MVLVRPRRVGPGELEAVVRRACLGRRRGPLLRLLRVVCLLRRLRDRRACRLGCRA